MRFFRKKVAKRIVLGDMDKIIQKASATCDRRDDLKYYTDLREFKDDLNYVTFNKTSFKATEELIDNLSKEDKITRANANCFLRRARIASHLSKGQKLPDLSQDELYDQKLDSIETQIRAKESRLATLHRQKDNFLDTNNELGWTRVKGDIDIITSELRSLNALFVSINNKKANILEAQTAMATTHDFELICDGPNAYVDLAKYEDDLSDQHEIAKQIQDESNIMARANSMYASELPQSFAEAKRARKSQLAQDAKEVAELEKEVASKARRAIKSKE